MSFYFIEPVHLQQVQVHPRNGLDQSLNDSFQRIFHLLLEPQRMLSLSHLKGSRDLELFENAGGDTAGGRSRESNLRLELRIPFIIIDEVKKMKLNLVADDDRAVDGGADQGLDEDVKVSIGFRNI